MAGNALAAHEHRTHMTQVRSFFDTLHDDDRDGWSLDAMRYRGCSRRVQSGHGCYDA